MPSGDHAGDVLDFFAWLVSWRRSPDFASASQISVW